jgi:protein-disulfide isomerase
MLDSLKTLNRVTGERIAEMVQARHDMFKDTIKYDADVAGWPVIGDAKSPVSVVMYSSGPCPTCKTNFRDLHAEVTRGRLRGKAKIIAKPLSTHISNLATIAAFDLGLFSEFQFHLAGAGRVEEQTLYEIADRLYIDRQVFKAKMESPEVLKRVEQSAKESEKNGVTHVPTYFIMGRRYQSVLIPFWIADAIEYVHETEILKK